MSTSDTEISGEEGAREREEERERGADRVRIDGFPPRKKKRTFPPPAAPPPPAVGLAAPKKDAMERCPAGGGPLLRIGAIFIEVGRERKERERERKERERLKF